MYFDFAGHIEKTEKYPSEICENFQFEHTNSLQCSKVKQDVRMLLATASSFLDGDDGVLMMTTMTTTSTRKTARTHTIVLQM